MTVLLAIRKAKAFIEEHVFDKSHDFSHIMAVLSHVQRIVLDHKGPSLDKDQMEDLNLAAIFHDLDDRKFFPDHKNHENARRALYEIIANPDVSFRVERIIYMIDLVSTSDNGNTIPVDKENMWMLYPRFADRLEAIGKIGVDRCKLYSMHAHRPLFLSTTPRCTSEEELWRVATPERFRNYIRTKDSASFIDHFYDKLLHIGSPDVVEPTENKYLINEFTARHKYMIDYILKFGKTGVCD